MNGRGGRGGLIEGVRVHVCAISGFAQLLGDISF